MDQWHAGAWPTSLYLFIALRSPSERSSRISFCHQGYGGEDGEERGGGRARAHRDT